MEGFKSNMEMHKLRFTKIIGKCFGIFSKLSITTLKKQTICGETELNSISVLISCIREVRRSKELD